MKDTEKPLTHNGQKIEKTGDHAYGVRGQEELVFTGSQLTRALLAKAMLHLQVEIEGMDTVTTEIGLLLRASQIIRESGNIEALLVKKEQP